ncbi:MAG: CRISPR-associated endonuclease Cas6 [Myxococcota bacterium]
MVAKNASNFGSKKNLFLMLSSVPDIDSQNSEQHANIGVIKMLPLLELSEIRLFRGAINHVFQNRETLMHNHEATDQYRYAYPLVQYNVDGIFTRIVAFNEAIELFYPLLEQPQFPLKIGKREIDFNVVDHTVLRFNFQPDLDFHAFFLRNWLPLSQKNKATFSQLKNNDERILLLEKILTGNILSMAKGLNVVLQGTLEVMIEEVFSHEKIKYKNVEFDAFTLKFRCNMAMPDGIGIGKGVSNGFGFLKNLELQ